MPNPRHRSSTSSFARPRLGMHSTPQTKTEKKASATPVTGSLSSPPAPAPHPPPPASVNG